MHADRQATEKKRPRVEKILLPPAVRLKNEKRPFPLRTKNRQRNPKQPLDRKSPIQVCELSLPQPSHREGNVDRAGSSSSSASSARKALGIVKWTVWVLDFAREFLPDEYEEVGRGQ